jgi:hypothetical protein
MRLVVAALLMTTTAVADDVPRDLAAPSITNVVAQQIAGRARQTFTSVTAHLASAPAQAVALVAFRAPSWALQSGDDVPLAAVSVVADDDEIYISLAAAARGGEPRPGDRIVFAWRDRSGRLSPRSREVVVSSK